MITEIRLWKQLIWRHFIKLLILGLLGAGSGFLFAFRDEPVYTANTRFMLKNEGVGSLFGGQMTGLTSLLGGGQMGTPLERTAEVISSDRIVGKALLRTTVIRDTQDLVINHFIRLSQIRKHWSRDTLLNKVDFRISDIEPIEMSIAQRKAYKIIKSLMAPEKGEGVVRKSFDKKSGVLTLSCVHLDEAFAIALSNIIYNELSDFFIEQMTFSSTNNAEVMRLKLDSIQGELNAVRRSYAAQTDQSLGLLLQQDKVDLKALAVKEQMLTVMYAEAVKNYEGYRFVNQAAMPSLTLIESPYAPLMPQSRSKFRFTLIFALLFVGAGLIYQRLKYLLLRY
jgi:uncharacterized protein involved in exopolysaccharide biosynthesis